jgi:hypothetical protein
MSFFVQKHYVGSRAYLYTFFIHIAIFFRAVISAIGGLFKKLFIYNRQNKSLENIAIVADKNTYAFIHQLITESNKKSKITGRIEPKNISTTESLGQFNKINEIITSYRINEVVFCENELSFKEIICAIQKLPENIICMFHANGADSVVCSNSKDNSGEYFAKSTKKATSF